MAQTINGLAISDIKSPYMLLMGTQRLLGPTVTIEVDFGEAGASKVFKKNSEVKILDENNRLIEVTTGEAMCFVGFAALHIAFVVRSTGK